MARPYVSPLRDEQARATRERLLQATYDLLDTDGIAALSLPRVAARAQVSAPTAYRFFPTLDNLLAEFLEWLRPLLGQTRERLLAAGSAQRLPAENFPAFEEHRRVLTALMDSRAFNVVRVASMSDRRRDAAEALAAAGAVWRGTELEIAAGAVYALASPQTWRWLRETWGLDADEAERASTWAIEQLIAALAEPRPKRSPRHQIRRSRTT